MEEGGYIGEALTKMDYIDTDELMPYLSRQMKVPYLKLGYYQIDEDLVELLPEKIVRSHKIFPFSKSGTLSI